MAFSTTLEAKVSRTSPQHKEFFPVIRVSSPAFRIPSSHWESDIKMITEIKKTLKSAWAMEVTVLALLDQKTGFLSRHQDGAS